MQAEGLFMYPKFMCCKIAECAVESSDSTSPESCRMEARDLLEPLVRERLEVATFGNVFPLRRPNVANARTVLAGQGYASRPCLLRATPASNRCDGGSNGNTARSPGKRRAGSPHNGGKPTRHPELTVSFVQGLTGRPISEEKFHPKLHVARGLS